MIRTARNLCLRRGWISEVRIQGPLSSSILALAFRDKSLEPSKVSPLRSEAVGFSVKEMSILWPHNQRQHRTSHIQMDVLPCALC